MDSKALLFITHQSFFSAVRSGDLESVTQIVDKLTKEQSDGSSPVSDLMVVQNDAGETALYVASDNNLHQVFSYLLQFCDLNTVKIRSNSDIDTFHVAAKKGHLGIVKELLGIWPELCKSCDSLNTSPLYSAAVRDHLEVVNAVLDADVSCTRIVRKNGKTALHTAARYGPLRIVKALIDRDPEIVSIKDKKGQTALHMAVKGESTSVVEEILLADHSILNERDKKGNTAVHMATRKSRLQIVSLLLSYASVDVNAINNQRETAMDLADKLQYGESTLEIKEALVEAGAKHARHVGKVDEAMELKRTVSDIKHEVSAQLIQNEQTNRRVSGIAKELRKLHREAVQNTTNSVTVVAVLFASIAFLAIFNLPGQYLIDGPEAGKANIADNVGFRVFCLLNTTSLFISLAVVVVQITLVAWDTRAQKQVVSVVNKLMWTACACTCGAFLSIAFVVVGKDNSWMAITITLMGAPILMGTLASMCYFVFRQHFGIFRNDSQRRIKRTGGSKSFSWSLYSANVSDVDYKSDLEKIYAL
ncbi:Ank_2 domain-containing protein/Ank_4 domain-containing protein/PGG domain-containing protein [Cephalotus follicularis]|uniref:Ank_2 domain-containing protein/Ank_4 domain-containing protein/PGG domain-containing protein n=1 Tax=Cephalotus follicularis TaxID=3775 RepID=A0A1Q3B1N3_CEPFO|nr:Ank_2 domain-containing protein/Ank_4 domain-containing protein/PGG domain-containing protein [Cephalotus follicularis]